MSHDISCSLEAPPALGPGCSSPTKTLQASDPLWVLVPSCAIHSWWLSSHWAHQGAQPGKDSPSTHRPLGGEQSGCQWKQDFPVAALGMDLNSHKAQLQLLPEISNIPDQMEKSNLLNFSWVCCTCLSVLGAAQWGWLLIHTEEKKCFVINSWRLPDEQQLRGVKNCYLAITSGCSHEEVLLDITCCIC